MPRSVVTATFNPTVDVSYTVDRLVPDDKLVARDHRRDPGGGGVNVSRALRRLGVESRAWLAAGGATGDELVAMLQAEGVDAIVHRVAAASAAATRWMRTKQKRSLRSWGAFVLTGAPN